MPSWAAIVPRSIHFARIRAIDRIPSSRWCRNVVPITSNFRLRSSTRNASTQVSPTAINVRAHIPPQHQELYNTLSELSVAADAYVNISRLQLALRGLAAQDAVTRVAVLSLNNQRSAQQLARLLLADPLGEETQWERELARSGTVENEPVLLKFGDETDAFPPSPLYKVYHIPSRILQKHNLEILISTLNVNLADTPTVSISESSKDAVLVPKLQATSARGLPVPFPVHKSLILGDGVESAVAYGRFSSDPTAGTSDMVRVAIDLPAPEKEMDVKESSSSSVVDIDVGTQALNSFRESIANSSKYEHGWFRSGMPTLSQWLVQGLEPLEPIKPVDKALITSVVDDVEFNVIKDDAQQLSRLTVSGTHQQNGVAMINHLEEWAENSHTELRDQLDGAFASPNWHKLSWWKLFWRVDDVGMISSEVLERRWLVDAEKSAVYLAGRMNQAGFSEVIQQPPVPVTSVTSDYSPTEESTSPVTPPPATSKASPEQSLNISSEVHDPQPWPTLIASTRTSLVRETIPPLQALAQRLVLTTLSTTSLSSALSALLYVSMPTFSVFEASAIAALGLMISLRRMQKLWEGSRSVWESEVREEGRRTLKHTEEVVRLIVKSSEKPVVEDEGAVERRKVREVVSNVREVLGRL